jgi:tripartite-type tricarboxylate transporter receptor subunit TctC
MCTIGKRLAQGFLGYAVLSTAVLLTGVMGTAAAAEFPEEPIEITELFGAGSSSDLTARILADGMSKRVGTPVVVVNRPGGGGALGYTYVKDRPADGYNIVWFSDSILTGYHLGVMGFDHAAFTPVARVCQEVPAIAVRSDSGWNTLQDLIAEAKKRPGELKVGISGKGSFTHLVSEAMFDKAGAEVRYVPYGKGNAAVELLGGRIDAALQWPSVFKSQADAGDLRIFAVTSADRLPSLPEVPTAKEEGIDMDMVLWRGIAAPAGTPPEVVSKLEGTIKDIVASEEFADAAQRIGCQPAFLPAEAFKGFIAEKDQEVAGLMEDLGLKRQ